jgi:hypothetical protein
LHNGKPVRIFGDYSAIIAQNCFTAPSLVKLPSELKFKKTFPNTTCKKDAEASHHV